MIMRSYHEQDEFQRHVRDAVLKPEFYERFYPQKYFFIDGEGKFPRMLQDLGVDTVVMTKDGPLSIQEKTVRWPDDELTGEPRDYGHDAYFFEMMANAKHGHLGWTRTCEADRLLYSFVQRDKSVISHLIDWTPCQRWFFERAETFPLSVINDPETQNFKEARVVKFTALPESIRVRRFHLAVKVDAVDA